jgi:hypothetical protein
MGPVGDGVVGGPGRVDGAGLSGEQVLCVLSHHPAGIGEDQVATRPLDEATPSADSSEARCCETEPGV